MQKTHCDLCNAIIPDNERDTSIELASPGSDGYDVLVGGVAMVKRRNRDTNEMLDADICSLCLRERFLLTDPTRSIVKGDFRATALRS